LAIATVNEAEAQPGLSPKRLTKTTAYLASRLTGPNSETNSPLLAVNLNIQMANQADATLPSKKAHR
jgi:hypothetical protein